MSASSLIHPFRSYYSCSTVRSPHKRLCVHSAQCPVLVHTGCGATCRPLLEPSEVRGHEQFSSLSGTVSFKCIFIFVLWGCNTHIATLAHTSTRILCHRCCLLLWFPRQQWQHRFRTLQRICFQADPTVTTVESTRGNGLPTSLEARYASLRVGTCDDRWSKSLLPFTPSFSPSSFPFHFPFPPRLFSCVWVAGG